VNLYSYFDVVVVTTYKHAQTMSHIVESCPLTKLNGGLSCGWRHSFLADQLCFTTCIQEEEEDWLDNSL